MKTLEEIKQEIEEEKKKYETPYTKDEGYELCKTFLDNNKLTKGEHLLEIDEWECFKCAIYVRSKKKLSLEKCERLRNLCELTFGPIKPTRCTKLADLLFIIQDRENRDEILNYIMEEDPEKAKEMLEAIPEPDANIYKITKGILDNDLYKKYLKELHDLQEKIGSIGEIEDYIKEYGDDFAAVLAFIVVIKQMEQGKEEIEKAFQATGVLTSRERNKVYAQFFSQFYNIKNLTEIYYQIQGFVTGEEKKEQDTDKENQRMQRVYNRTLEDLEKAKEKEEISNARELIRGIPREEIKKDILEWVYNHNKAYYDKLEEELSELSSKAINKYIAILGRFGISLHPKDIQTISHNKPEEVEEILSAISTYEKEDMILILQGTNIQIARQVKKYIDLGYITGVKVMENISLYFEGDPKLEDISTSIEIFNSQGINPKIFASQPEYFWTNNDLLNHNLMILSTYNLTKNIKNNENFDFLLEDNLEEKIDMWIELGFYSFLEQNLELLNQSRLRVRRLQLLQQMNIPVEDIDTIESVLESSKFIVNDGSLKDYIMDYASLQKPLDIPYSKEDLANMEGDKVSMRIKGVVFSLPKIKRRVEAGDSMWKAIFYGKNLTEEEYKQVMSVLTPNTDCKK